MVVEARRHNSGGYGSGRTPFFLRFVLQQITRQTPPESSSSQARRASRQAIAGWVIPMIFPSSARGSPRHSRVSGTPKDAWARLRLGGGGDAASGRRRHHRDVVVGEFVRRIGPAVWRAGKCWRPGVFAFFSELSRKRRGKEYPRPSGFANTSLFFRYPPPHTDQQRGMSWMFSGSGMR